MDKRRATFYEPNKMNNLKDTRKAGFYFKDGKPYVSVTTVLKIIDKSDQLLKWAAKEAYLAMKKDPNCTEEQAVNAHITMRDNAASRGSTIHSLIELMKTSDQTINQVPPPFQGYYNAFKDWVEKNKPEFLEQEKTLFSDTLKTAGTCDGIVKIKDKTYLIDFKTNKAGRIYPEVELQLSAYQFMAEEQGIKIDGTLAIGLSEEGKYTEAYMKYLPDTFGHALELWIWKNKAKCEEVGY